MFRSFSIGIKAHFLQFLSHEVSDQNPSSISNVIFYDLLCLNSQKVCPPLASNILTVNSVRLVLYTCKKIFLHENTGFHEVSMREEINSYCFYRHMRNHTVYLQIYGQQPDVYVSGNTRYLAGNCGGIYVPPTVETLCVRTTLMLTLRHFKGK